MKKSSNFSNSPCQPHNDVDAIKQRYIQVQPGDCAASPAMKFYFDNVTGDVLDSQNLPDEEKDAVIKHVHKLK